MAKKRRTRQQKIKARQRILQFKKIDINFNKLALKTVKEKMKENDSLFTYDTALIKADLTKTVVLSILAVIAIVAIYLFKIL